MRVGAIVPVYGEAPWLGEALDALLAQDPRPDEIVVVDDGSPRPVALEPGFAERVHLVRRAERGGPAAARATGLGAQTADLIALADADDAWEAGKLAAQLEALERHPEAAVCFGRAVVIGPDGEPTGESFEELPAGLLEPERLGPLLFERNPIPASSVIVRRHALEAAGGFHAPTLVAEDWDLWLRLLRRGERFFNEPAAVVRYRRHPRALTGDVTGLAAAELTLHAAHAELADEPTRRRVRARNLRSLARGRVRERRFGEAREALREAAALAAPTARERAYASALAVPVLRGALGRRDPYPGSRPRSRLAYVSGTYPALSETFVTGELRELSRRGEEPRVFAVVRGDADLRGAPPARYVVELRKGEQLAALLGLLARRPLRTARSLLDPSRRFGGSARDMAALAPLAQALGGVKHVHAHFAGQPAAIAGRLSELTAVPFSFTAHAHDIFLEWERMAEKLSSARFAVTVCEYNRRYIEDRLPAQRDKLHVVVCGVDLSEFRRSQPYAADGPIVAVGRLVEQKGFDHLIQAAVLAGDALPEVVIAGEGPERIRLERMIGDLGARVRLIGALRHAEVRALYESASIAVLPCVVASDGDRDSMPVALKEAMALELPVVGTDEVGIPELIGPDRGLLVPPGDDRALAQALAELHARPAEERAAMGVAGRAFVAERCNLATETSRLLWLFDLDRSR
jgi:colanic acid/amylovoran biosynthesis glycosyltransferase